MPRYITSPLALAAGALLASAAVAAGRLVPARTSGTLRSPLTHRASRTIPAPHSATGMGPCPGAVTITDGLYSPYNRSTAKITVALDEDASIPRCISSGGPDPSTFQFTVDGVDRTSYFTVSSGLAVGNNVPLAPGATHTVVASAQGYDASGTLTTLSDSRTVDVLTGSLPMYGVTDAATPARTYALLGHAGLAHQFRVTSTGANQATYAITVSCSGAAAGGACTVSPTSVVLDSAASALVSVSYTSTNAAVGTTGQITVTATKSDDATIASSASASLTVGTAQTPALSTTDVNSGTTIARDLCLTVKVASDAAFECGDLRVAYALPGIRTLGKARVPTLLYSSQHAHPYPLVAATVTAGATAATPDTVIAVLTVNDSLKGRWTWAGAEWNDADARGRRIVVGYDGLGDSTGIRPYKLTVINRYNAYGGVAAVNDTVVSPGELVVVNRAQSRLGAGWAVAGVERLYTATPATRMLWVDGDGDARVYTPVSGMANTWVAPTVDAPDTIAADGGGYVRIARHRLRVRFDAQGRHVATINRLGDSTAFSYGGTSGYELQTITIPPKGTLYQFTYDQGGVGYLDYIEAPVSATPVRIIEAYVNGGKLVRLDDPATTGQTPANVQFTYDATDANRMTWRTNRRGFATRFAYDAGRKLALVSTPDAAPPFTTPDSSVTRFYAFESRGVSGSGTPASIDALTGAGSIDGPRTNVADVTQFRLDKFGAPVRIVDALGAVTQLAREDARWPGVVTRVQYPDGGLRRAVLDSRGLDSLVLDSLNRVAGEWDVTSYQYDPKWHFVTRIVRPLGDYVVMTYDPTTGNRLTQQDARGAVSQISYTYNPAGTFPAGYLRTTASTLTVPGHEDKVDYDSLGNVNKETTPIGFFTTFTHDQFGRDSVVSAPFDSAGTYRITTTTLYDFVGRDTSVTSSVPAISYTSPIDGSSRQSRVPEAMTLSKGYDGQGNLVQTKRTMSRNPNGFLGGLTVAYEYDQADRKTKETAPDNQSDRWSYDQSGNVLTGTDRRGVAVSMGYDALNRLSARGFPPVAYAETTFFGRAFPRNSTTGITVPGSVERFAYDVMGRMIAADNADARVRRRWNQDGTLAVDTLSIDTYAHSGLFTEHRYVTSYTYDRDGRRTKVTYPSQLRPKMANVYRGDAQYTYSPWGSDSTVTTLSGGTVVSSYDAEARPATTTYPGGVIETREYDPDGRLWHHRLTTPNDSGLVSGSNGMIHDDTLRFDAQGRTILMLGMFKEAHELHHSGLGALVNKIDGTRTLNGTLWTFAINADEGWDVDPLGNNVWWRWPTKDGPTTTNYTYDTTTGRLIKSVASTTGGVSDTTLYDPAGNQHLQRRIDWTPAACQPGLSCSTGSGMVAYTQTTAWYYGADGRLHAMDRRASLTGVETGGGFEEYRYDALGRRVLRRWRSDADVSPNIYSTVERTVYDGDNVLVEVRRDGSDASTTMENDLPEGVIDNNFGSVVYTHVGGIDHPVEFVRTGYPTAKSQPGDFAMTPYTNWRGQFDIGTFSGGNVQRTGYEISWPQQNASATFVNRQQDGHWLGSLVADRRDGSRQLFMRNRYVDPTTGRFTQEDPLGLAGGMNAYGFAKGDAVDYSDPFGLCVKGDVDCQNLVRLLRQQRGREFQRAADRYAALSKGRVHFYSQEMTAGRADDRLNANGNPSDYVLGHTNVSEAVAPEADVYLRGDVSKEDLLFTAVHESYHLAGERHEDMSAQESAAWAELGSAGRQRAYLSDHILHGTPLPSSYREPVSRQVPYPGTATIP